MATSTQSKADQTTATSDASKETLNIMLSVMLSDGNKGGVGKSFFSRALYDYLVAVGQPTVGVEADMNSPDFAGVVKDAECIEFSEDQEKIDDPNLLFDILTEDNSHAVVNLGAACHSAFKRWIDTFDVPTLLAQHDRRMIKFFVTSGEFDSLASLKLSMTDLGEQIPHVVVKNLKYSDWDYYDDNKEIQGLIKQHNCPVIELPKMPTRIASFLLQKRLSLAEAATYKGNRSIGERFGIGEQACVSKFRRDFAAQMNNVWEQLQ